MLSFEEKIKRQEKESQRLYDKYEKSLKRERTKEIRKLLNFRELYNDFENDGNKSVYDFKDFLKNKSLLDNIDEEEVINIINHSKEYDIKSFKKIYDFIRKKHLS